MSTTTVCNWHALPILYPLRCNMHKHHCMKGTNKPVCTVGKKIRVSLSFWRALFVCSSSAVERPQTVLGRLHRRDDQSSVSSCWSRSLVWSTRGGTWRVRQAALPRQRSSSHRPYNQQQTSNTFCAVGCRLCSSGTYSMSLVVTSYMVVATACIY